jgi:Tol biopolymer transport system component
VELLRPETSTERRPNDWSPDGHILLFTQEQPNSGRGLWVLRVSGYEEHGARPVVQTTFDEEDGQFSPDGKWIAYQSDVSGRTEVYVQPFPASGDRLQILTNSGAQPRCAWTATLVA